MKIQSVGPHLHAIVLDQKIPGFQDFICSWLSTGKNRLLVDPGPAATIPELVQAMESLGVSSLDAILLTHIHIDHAGGAGGVVHQMGPVPVICHPKARAHLVNPEKLWQGSLKTLGQTARAYGPIAPVSEGLLMDASEWENRESPLGFSAVLTPGHAPHHVSFLVDDVLFAGECAGVRIPLDPEEPEGAFFMRPATPPRFFYDTHLASLEKLAQIPAKTLVFGHFGATRNPREMFRAQKKQLALWLETIRDVKNTACEGELFSLCLEALLKKDPLLGTWNKLPGPVQGRERYFMKNSVRGFLGWLDS